MAEQTRDLYAVARGTEVLTDRRTSVEQTKHDLAFIETSIRNAGLEPDVQIVQVTETTTLGPGPVRGARSGRRRRRARGGRGADRAGADRDRRARGRRRRRRRGPRGVALMARI